MFEVVGLVGEVVRRFAESGESMAELCAVLARQLAAVLGDHCSVMLRSEDGRDLVSLAMHSDDPFVEARARAVLGVPLELAAHPTLRRVLETGQLFTDVIEPDRAPAQVAPRYLAYVEEIGLRSIMVLPLRARGEVFGVVVVSRTTPTAHQRSDCELAGIVTDIAGLAIANARRATEHEMIGASLDRLRASEALFRGLLESAPDAIVCVDRYGAIRLVNAKTEQLFGYSRVELTGKPIEILVPERFRANHPRNRAAFFANPTARGMGTTLELWGLRKDGRELRVEISLSPLTLEHETLVSAAIRDITERKRAEVLFRDLLEAAPDAMVIVDGDGRIKLINAQTERLFGYRREELIDQWVELLVPERFRAAHGNHRSGFAREPRTRAMGSGLELFGRRKDGSEFPIEISLAPLHTADGMLVSSAIRDITLRKQLEEKMQEANRLKSEFLANMSHELRTPLNAILGFTELMHKGKAGPVSDDHREYLGDILSSARHLLRLINDVLDLAKVESGKMEFRLEQVDVTQLVHEICEVLKGLATQRHIQLAVTGAATPASADPARIKQVLYNLLSNAIKFSHDGGRIAIDVIDHGSEIRVDVIDGGIGIAESDLPKLFNEFQQLDSGSGKHYQGTGLGLALTRRILEGHGGRIEVSSVLGQGSRFTAILPRGAT